MSNDLALLPPNINLETIPVLKQLALSNRYLAELKGLVAAIPNAEILINTLSLQEAKDSSAVENIITTHDDLFKADIFSDYVKSPAAKEVNDYAHALRSGFAEVKKSRLIRLETILSIQAEMEKNNAGLRKVPGTGLKNLQTGETVYTPPQRHEEIKNLMANLITFINDENMCDLDPLIKMAIMHFQFESIHPFYDANGRTGRILNILYLVKEGLLDIPVLYLSRYIIQNKDKYYNGLRNVNQNGMWEDWLLYMLRGIEITAKQTITLVTEIRKLILASKKTMREKLPKIYSSDLLNNLFKHPYTKIEFVENDLKVTRITATKYLDSLADKDVNILEKHKIGRNNYYINRALFDLLSFPPAYE
ncbi:MAG: Fic family protein [Planctomycetota bacterium]